MTAEGRKKHCVAIARNDLRRGGLDGKSELFGDIGFDARIDIRISPDGAGNRAGRDFLPRMHEPLAGAQKFGIGLRELQPEGHWLGVDAMRAADRRGQLVFERAAFQRGKQSVDVGQKNVGRAGELHGKTRVEHVGRRHALVHKPRLGTDEFGEVGQEGDHVMMRDLFDLVDPRRVKRYMTGLFPDRLGGLLGDDADFGQRIAGMRLDLEPDAKPRPRLPYGGHFGPGIARDHSGTLGGRRGMAPS